MNDGDKKYFAEIWDAALQTGGRDSSPPILRLAFNALSGYSIEQVERALGEHVAKSNRAPTPADIRGIIEESVPGGRPGAEEAWSIAIGAMDEMATVVWTEEIAAAWGVAQPIMQSGDDVGARMAFREAYARKVDEAQREGRPAKWSPSLGQDPQGRAVALSQAVEAGRLGRDIAESLLPAPAPSQDGSAIAGLLTSNSPEPASEDVRARMAEVREAIAKGRSDG